MEPHSHQPPRAPADDRGPAIVRLGRLVVLRFLAQGMTVYAGALAYRGLLALVPLALIVLALIGLLGMEGSLPRITAALLRLRGATGGAGGAAAVPLEGLLSAGAVVGTWSIATGARLLMRALNAAHAVEEARPPVARFAFSLVFLPALAVVTVAAMVLLLVTTRIVGWIGAWIGVGPVLDFLGSWLRLPAALALLAFPWAPCSASVPACGRRAGPWPRARPSRSSCGPSCRRGSALPCRPCSTTDRPTAASARRSRCSSTSTSWRSCCCSARR